MNSDATVAGLAVSAVVSVGLSTTRVPSAGSSFSVMPIDASVVPVLPEPTAPPTTEASAFWIVSSVESPSSGPCDEEDELYDVSVAIVVTTVLYRLTKVLIALLSAVVSGVTFSVCDVVTAAADRFSVTPEMALVTELLALVAAMPLIENSASCAKALRDQALLEFGEVILH